MAFIGVALFAAGHWFPLLHVLGAYTVGFAIGGKAVQVEYQEAQGEPR